MTLIPRSGANLKRTPLSSSKPLRKNTPLKKMGPKAQAWREYRNNRAQKDQDEDGLLKCQDHLIGLPTCGIARAPEKMDLHHIKGREEAPKLYFDDSNNIWLTRDCHNEAHNNG